MIHEHKNDSFPYLLPEDQVTLIPDNTELDTTIKMWKASCLTDLEYTLQQISLIPTSRVFESIKTFYIDLLENYSPQQIIRINQAFLPKILNDLSIKSLIESIQIIDEHRDFIFKKLYLPKLLSNKSPIESIKIIDNHSDIIYKDLYQTLIDLYLPKLIEDLKSKPNPDEIVESIRTHISEELYSRIIGSISKKGMRKKSNKKSKRHVRKSKKKGRKRLKVVRYI